ncbi:hypothetical protein IQ264_27415 [Phormidium sp. LEGE 05292]|uniref:hypothetical protein n=1 Tax=[Phormidium] sp. LEGE 05292 TaxID=767427 RepID=UPI00188120F4|nr:hypothetical protein [Phormidium sp. LEGE 05292]MBE9229136.1 hypothetical protein [Phormidium sp. LEGE 05292]
MSDRKLELIVNRENYPEIDELIDRLGGEILMAIAQRKMTVADLPEPYQRVLDAIDRWEVEIKGRES